MRVLPFEPEDISQLAALQPTGWQDIQPVFDFYLQNNFCFPMKVLKDHTLVGIGTTIIHHNIAWLAHIIVHPDYRNQGIGRLITQTLVDSPEAKKCETIQLIATELGAPVYEKVGFVTETEYLFFKDLRADSRWSISPNIRSFEYKFIDQVAALDRRVSMESRMFHLEKHLPYGFVYLVDDLVQGYYLPTFGDGLIIASSASAGLELMKWRLTTKNFAAFPIDNTNASEFMYQNHFREAGRGKRMRLGKQQAWSPTEIYNRIGGNLG
jgi:GNAT superfamily N-acetyltransferase